MLIKRIKRATKALLYDEASILWPCPKVEIEDEPHFFFILTPPYSGSTALAKILNTAQGAALLHDNAEGQWLVPGMRDDARWDPAKVIHWDSVRATWLHRIQTLRANVQVDFVIEKSPPHMVRLEQLLRVFPNHSLMAFNRDPFANCASILYRHHEPQNKTKPERIRILEDLAREWLFRSGWVRKWIQEKNVVYFSYEQFCADPEGCVSLLTPQIPALQTVQVNKAIKIKDYQRQKLENHNARQFGNLNPREIYAISEQLKADSALVSFFGYEVVNGT